MHHCRTLSICFIIILYGLLQGLYFREAGDVGEVAIGWSSPPRVIIQTHPVAFDHGDKWGALRARETRPTQTVVLGDTHFPLAINSYTSALPDWPSFLLHKIYPDPTTIRWFHITLGGALIVLCLRLFGFSTSIFMGLVLSTDWTFLFYKNLLGGTELCLQLASMGLLWVLWNKKSWGWLIFWTALGIQAKITFFFVAIPVIFTVLLFRVPLPKEGIRNGLGISFLLFIPLIIQAFHHHTLEGLVQSHDTWSMQSNRILQAFSGSSVEAIREQGGNILLWMTNPLHFYERIYELPPTWTWISIIRSVGWFLCFGICITHRRDKDIQKYSLLIILAMISISYGPKDLHHYAMIIPIWALWLALIAKTFHKWIVIPFVFSGILMCMHTDRVLGQIQVPTFSASQQKELISMLEQEKVQQLVTMDYEVYGLLEYQNTDIEIVHGWGAISHKRYQALPELMAQAEAGHLIVLKSSMPMRYNLKPTLQMMEDAAQKKGLHIEVQNQNARWILVRVYRSATEER